jgi:hypothetical protein
MMPPEVVIALEPAIPGAGRARQEAWLPGSSSGSRLGTAPGTLTRGQGLTMKVLDRSGPSPAPLNGKAA